MKKILTFIFVALLPLVANAYDAQIDGIYYNFSGDEAEVTYREEWSISYSGTVVIPESVTYSDNTYNVTSIGANAFWCCSGLTSITIPASVTSIGDGAFVDCSGLTSITIPNSVTSIGQNSFYGCSGLTSITISNSVTSIGGFAFFGCRGLTSITIPNSVTSIGGNAFRGCSGLRSITIPNSVTDIGGCVFGWCSGLTSIKVAEGNTTYDSRNDCNAIIETATNTLIASCKNTTIPEDVTSIGDEAFCGSIGLTSVTIPGSVTSIGEGAFSSCDGLTSIEVAENNTTYDSRNDCNAIIETATNTLIAGCQNTIIPESVTSIGYQAFYNCISLISVTIPNSVTSIGGFAFFGCRGLTSITIPNSVTTFGYMPFHGCSGLTSVIVERATPLTLDTDPFFDRANATLYVPYGSKSAYEAADYWNEFKEIVETTRVTIGSTGYATYCSECDLDFSEVSGLKAYIASGFSPSTGKLVLTRVTEVPAGEGLYIVGDEGRFYIPATTTDMLYSNLLKGVTTATTIYPTDGDYTNFILANGSHGVAFYSLSEAGELAAGKAYLQLPTASVSEVKAISVIFDDDEDAVLSIEEDSQTQRIYNLQGQQVNAPKSGLYIINGKKVFIK